MKSTRSLLLVVLSACWTIAGGQELNSLVDSMIVSNPELRYYDISYRAALEQVAQVNTLPDPEFGIGGFVLPVETRLGAQRVRFSGTQMFPWFGTLDARESLAEANAITELQPGRIKVLDLRYRLSNAYLDLYENIKTQEIMQREIDVLVVLRPYLISKIESGEGSMADVLRLDTRIAEMKQELVILDARQQAPMAEINQLIGRDPGTSVSVIGTLDFAMIPYLMDTLVPYIEASHPAIKLYELKQLEAQRRIEVNNKMRMPSLGVGADYIIVSPRDDLMPDRNGRDILQLKAMISVPLYGRKYDAREREESLRIEALEQMKENAVSQFAAQVNTTLANHRAAQLQMELYSSQLNNVKSARRILESDYSANGDRFDELLEIEMELLNYDLKILRAVVESHRTLTVLERLSDYIN